MSEESDLRREVEELKKKRGALKKTAEGLKGENDTLLERLTNQGKDHAERFCFQFEDADVRGKIRRSFDTLYAKAKDIADQSYSGDGTAQDRSARHDIIEALMQVMKFVLDAAKRTYDNLRSSLGDLLRRIDIPAEEKIVNSPILTDLIRHIAANGSQDSQETPVTFKQDNLVDWEKLSSTAQLQTLRNLLANSEDIHRLLEPFLSNCCAFSWQWQIFRERGQVNCNAPRYGFQEKFYKFADRKPFLEKGEQPTVRLIWPLLLDQSGTVLQKGIVVLPTNNY